MIKWLSPLLWLLALVWLPSLLDPVMGNVCLLTAGWVVVVGWADNLVVAATLVAWVEV